MEHLTLYTYNVEKCTVIDGDTVELSFNLGFNVVYAKQRCRIRGINAPELTGSEKARGLAAKAYLERFINGRDIVVTTHKDKFDKYGRYLIDMYIVRKDKTGCVVESVNVAGQMIKVGHATAM